MLKIIDIIKGFIVGGSMLIPGVSGGTMAMILGVYDRLLEAVGGFFQDIKRNFLFLLTFSIGGIMGILILAKPLLFVYTTFTFLTSFFFIGAIAGSVPLTFKEAKIIKPRFTDLIFLGIGIAIIIGLSNLPPNLLAPTQTTWLNNLMMLAAGLIAAVALVLPGISVSYMLLVLGIFESTMTAINSFDIKPLFFLGIGLAIGVLATTKALEALLKKYTQKAYLIILGFVLASTVEIFPGLPIGIDILYCIVLFLMGFLIVYMISFKKIPFVKIKSPH